MDAELEPKLPGGLAVIVQTNHRSIEPMPPEGLRIIWPERYRRNQPSCFIGIGTSVVSAPDRMSGFSYG